MARLAVEDHEIAGYPVTKGMAWAMAQWVVHRDPRDGMTRQKNFSRSAGNDDYGNDCRGSLNFPFGGGPRQCIGNAFALMEATLILATIARKFRLRLVANHPVAPLESIKLSHGNGVGVTLESRPEMRRRRHSAGTIGRCGLIVSSSVKRSQRKEKLPRECSHLLAVAREPSSERVCTHPRMESRVTMPTI